MQWSSRQRSVGAGLAASAAILTLGACAAVRSDPTNISTASIRLDDDGLGPAAAPDASRPGVRSPIAQICAYPGGKQVLDADLPGLTNRPEYIFFASMSLPQLKVMSKGQLREEDIAKVDADLRRLP